MDYSFKRGFKPDLDRIKEVLEEQFPVEIKQEGSKLSLSFGALKCLCTWIENKKLCVTTESESGISDDLVLDTNKRYRKFLEAATGYTAKQRMQMAKKEAASKDE